MKNNVYCVCAQASENSKVVYFKFVHADSLDSLSNSAKTPHLLTPRIVFVLGPFLDNDEAKDVQSQAHRLLAKYRVQRDWLGINPLDIAEFWKWVDAQILPIDVHEKRTRIGRSYTSIRKVRGKVVSADQRAAVEHRAVKTSGSQ